MLKEPLLNTVNVVTEPFTNIDSIPNFCSKHCIEVLPRRRGAPSYKAASGCKGKQDLCTAGTNKTLRPKEQERTLVSEQCRPLCALRIRRIFREPCSSRPVTNNRRLTYTTREHNWRGGSRGKRMACMCAYLRPASMPNRVLVYLPAIEQKLKSLQDCA